MGGVTIEERHSLYALAHQLATIDLVRRAPIAGILRPLRDLVNVDVVVCASAVECVQGWELERFDCAGSPDDARLRRLLAQFLATAPRRFGWYDAVDPEREQRDVVVELDQLVPRDEARASALFQRVLAPLRLDDMVIERILICDGGRLLAWYGVIHRERLTPRQRELWTTLVPTLRRRLATERDLDTGGLHAVALDTVLARVGVPALVVSAKGVIREANPAAKRLLAAGRAEVEASLEALQAGKPAPLPFELTLLQPGGMEPEWLALLPAHTPDARRASALAIAAVRLGLTRRQADVLEGVVRGEGTQEIAVRLGVTARAIEQHLSMLFALTRASTRSALISFVLLAP